MQKNVKNFRRTIYTIRHCTHTYYNPIIKGSSKQQLFLTHTHKWIPKAPKLINVNEASNSENQLKKFPSELCLCLYLSACALSGCCYSTDFCNIYRRRKYTIKVEKIYTTKKTHRHTYTHNHTDTQRASLLLCASSIRIFVCVCVENVSAQIHNPLSKQLALNCNRSLELLKTYRSRIHFNMKFSIWYASAVWNSQSISSKWEILYEL